ncbi:MAG: hypothetical protein IKW93_06450 [Bacteroidales bacterium]|nr:hypothetical protein [Bacteroidales bacterium]
MRKREIIKNKTVMWSKIKALSEDYGYNKNKIARILGIHRETVWKYLSVVSKSKDTSFLKAIHNSYRVFLGC